VEKTSGHAGRLASVMITLPAAVGVLILASDAVTLRNAVSRHRAWRSVDIWENF
jgi:hypothetical protein